MHAPSEEGPPLRLIPPRRIWPVLLDRARGCGFVWERGPACTSLRRKLEGCGTGVATASPGLDPDGNYTGRRPAAPLRQQMVARYGVELAALRMKTDCPAGPLGTQSSTFISNAAPTRANEKISVAMSARPCISRRLPFAMLVKSVSHSSPSSPGVVLVQNIDLLIFNNNVLHYFKIASSTRKSNDAISNINNIGRTKEILGGYKFRSEHPG